MGGCIPAMRVPPPPETPLRRPLPSPGPWRAVETLQPGRGRRALGAETFPSPAACATFPPPLRQYKRGGRPRPGPPDRLPACGRGPARSPRLPEARRGLACSWQRQRRRLGRAAPWLSFASGGWSGSCTPRRGERPSAPPAPATPARPPRWRRWWWWRRVGAPPAGLSRPRPLPRRREGPGAVVPRPTASPPPPSLPPPLRSAPTAGAGAAGPSRGGEAEGPVERGGRRGRFQGGGRPRRSALIGG